MIEFTVTLMSTDRMHTKSEAIYAIDIDIACASAVHGLRNNSDWFIVAIRQTDAIDMDCVL